MYITARRTNLKVIGITETQIRAITEGLDLTLGNFRSTHAHSHMFRVQPRSAGNKYARTSASGRRQRAACYHAFRDVIRRFFEAGATSIGTRAFPHVIHTEAEFEDMLPKLAYRNVGSYMNPAPFIELCACGTSLYAAVGS